MPILLVNEIPFYEGPCLLSKCTLNKNLADSILKREEDMKAAVFHFKQVLKVTMQTNVYSVNPFCQVRNAHAQLLAHAPYVHSRKVR